MDTDHTCGRREAVDRGQRETRDRTGRRERKGEMGTRDNGEKRKQHTARCFPLPEQRKRDSNCNKWNHSSSSNRSSTSSSTPTRKTPMIRNQYILVKTRRRVTASVQAAILIGDGLSQVQNLLFLDVTPLSIR